MRGLIFSLNSSWFPGSSPAALPPRSPGSHSVQWDPALDGQGTTACRPLSNVGWGKGEVHTRPHTHVHTHTRTHSHTHPHVCAHGLTRHTRAHTHVCAHTRVHTRSHMTHTCARTHAHTLTRVHMRAGQWQVLRSALAPTAGAPHWAPRCRGGWCRERGEKRLKRKDGLCVQDLGVAPLSSALVCP